jgi:hypothetical protein
MSVDSPIQVGFIAALRPDVTGLDGSEKTWEFYHLCLEPLTAFARGYSNNSVRRSLLKSDGPPSTWWHERR